MTYKIYWTSKHMTQNLYQVCYTAKSMFHKFPQTSKVMTRNILDFKVYPL